MSAADITIIVPTFNRRHVLTHTLPVYVALAQRHPLLIIDDGSTDGTAAWLSALGLRVVRHPRRFGLPAARNTGLRLATTPWVFFGEDDVVMPADHPQTLLKWAEGQRNVAAVAGRLFAGTSWTLPALPPPDGTRPLLDPISCTGAFDAPLTAPRPLPSLHACALIRRAAALAVGGYDRTWIDSAFREESDFYARLWHAGHACWLVSEAWAIHVRHRLGGGARGGTSLAQRLRNRWSYWRNDLRFHRRHHRAWQRWVPTVPGPGCFALAASRRLGRNLWHQVTQR